jgi:hypothetical protein
MGYPECKRCGSATHMEKNGLGNEIICCDKCEWLYNVEQTKKIIESQNND